MKSDSDDLPGGFMRFISVTDDSAVVRRVWQRGLAIGVRGLTLELDKVTGEVLRSSALGSLPIPPPPERPSLMSTWSSRQERVRSAAMS